MSNKKRVDSDMLFHLREELEESINKLSVFLDGIKTPEAIGGAEVPIDMLKNLAENVAAKANNLAKIKAIK
jgi:hypothetical protein